MNRLPRRFLARELAAAYQDEAVIPHCATCARPCCRLDTLVLELEWKQIKSFWKIEASRPAFDRQLASGAGPQEVRAGNGLYYVHGKACPAYDEAGACRVYGQALKPPGCSDFPVYEDGDCIVADLRCEAVSLDDLVARIGGVVGRDFRVVRSPDEEFPFLVSLWVKPQRQRRKSGD